MSNLESSKENNDNTIKDLKLEINQLNERIKNKNKYIKERNTIIARLENDKENIIRNLKEKNYIFENKSKEEKIKFNIELERLHDEYVRKKQYLELETKKVKEEKSRYTKEYQEKLKTTSSEFVKETVKDLEVREKKLSKHANLWSISGAAVLAIGLILTIIISFWNSFGISSNMSWPFLIFFSFKGLVVLTIVGFFTRYNFVHSGNYMQESLKIADRIHAIKFGQFYIETYGATATWEEVKEVFSSWNGEEKTKWEKNIQYDELNNAMKTISSAIDKLKIQKDDAEKKDKTKENGIKQN